MKPRRILHVVGAMDRAGAETMIMNLYREIDRTLYQFDFLCFGYGPNDYDDEILELGGDIIYIKSTNPITRFLQTLSILRRGRWGIVHSHTLFSSGLHLLAAKLVGVRSRIVHSHSTSSKLKPSFADKIYRSTMSALLKRVPTHYISCGEAAARHLFGPRDDVIILPNAIDIDRFTTACIPQEPDNPIRGEPDLIILQVGRMMEVKNHKFSIMIANSLKELGVSFNMIFVGDGPCRTELEKAIANYGLNTFVTITGLRKDIPELMAMADVMLMPSLYEGFPVVLVESQAAGLPAVISNTISNEVDLGIGLVDFLHLTGSSEEWAQRVIDCANRKIMPEKKRREVIDAKGFSAQRSAAIVTNFYENL